MQLSAADLVGKMMDVTLNLDSVDGPVKRLSGGELEDDISPTAASRELWETGSLKSKIPDGFYSVVPVVVAFFSSQDFILPSMIMSYVLLQVCCSDTSKYCRMRT